MPGRADGLVVRDVQDGADVSKRREDRGREQDLEHAHEDRVGAEVGHGPTEVACRKRVGDLEQRLGGASLGAERSIVGVVARSGGAGQEGDLVAGRAQAAREELEIRLDAAFLGRPVGDEQDAHQPAAASSAARTTARLARPSSRVGSPTSAPRTRATKARSAAAYEGSELGRTASRSRSRSSSLVGASLPGCRCTEPLCRSILIVPSEPASSRTSSWGGAKADLDLRFRSVGQAQAEDRSVVLAPAGGHDRGHVLDLGVEQEPEEIDVMRCQIEESATAVGPRELPGRQVLPWIRERGANVADPSDPARPDDGACASDRRMEPPVESDRGDDSGRSRRGDDPLPVGEARGQRLLEVEVTAGLGDGDPKLRVEAARRRHEDGVDVVAGKQLARVAATSGARRQAPGGGERCRVGIGERRDRDSAVRVSTGRCTARAIEPHPTAPIRTSCIVRNVAPGGSRTR